MSQTSRMNLHKRGTQLEISLEIPAGVQEIEVRIYSDRNNPVSKLSDISHRHPEREQLLAQPKTAGEVLFPVIDLELEPAMAAVVTFRADTEGEYVMNGAFNKRKEPLSREIEIDASVLEHWENSLWVSGQSEVERFIVKQTFRVNERIGFRHTYWLLSEDWNGTVEVYGTSSDGTQLLARAAYEGPKLQQAAAVSLIEGDAWNSELLLSKLDLALTYIRNSQNRNPRSPFYEGLYLFYDHDARTYRSPNWIWSWGPAVKLLVESDKLAAFAGQGLLQTAEQIGQTSLLFRKQHLAHPAHGITTSRWKYGSQLEYGVVECHSAADANFLSGWAWIPLFEATGNRDFLNGAAQLALSTEALISEFEIAPMDYLEEPKGWTNWSIDEIGFCTEGLSELYRVTGDERYKKIGENWIDKVLDKLERPDGLWDRSWLRNERMRLTCEYMTRGLGWGMEGLIAAHRLSPSGKYLEKAIKMAEAVIGMQHESGCWAHYCNQSLEAAGAGEKATSLWSLLLYRLFRFTNDKRHLEAARKALQWCLTNVYEGGDREGLGGIIGCTVQSGVVYRQWYRLSNVYTSGFFGLAILEELKLREH
ncbi:hypothetical protein [Paenibacillus piri]|uniref:Uncharacterized protein n=1 Tax=Paenibacillus piri TaxID=2547395 RepID=A0A4R5KYH7_9BACL|nr:hypothetical protein [Paenibacillus piri]TDG00299.1 hypothetical protein E1757_01250 [Paenibacillus piri]